MEARVRGRIIGKEGWRVIRGRGSTWRGTGRIPGRWLCIIGIEDGPRLEGRRLHVKVFSEGHMIGVENARGRGVS